MMDRLTDNEIVKVLECCIKQRCESCLQYGMYADDEDCMRFAMENALDLINRKDAKIEGLKSDYTRVCAERDARIVTQSFTKSEAYREFAEKMKEISKEVTVPYIADTSIQEHKTDMFYYGKEDFDNALNKLLSNDMGRYDHYTDSFVKETAESNE